MWILPPEIIVSSGYLLIPSTPVIDSDRRRTICRTVLHSSTNNSDRILSTMDCSSGGITKASVSSIESPFATSSSYANSTT